jgi:hypothetical protein
MPAESGKERLYWLSLVTPRQIELRFPSRNTHTQNPQFDFSAAGLFASLENVLSCSNAQSRTLGQKRQATLNQVNLAKSLKIEHRFGVLAVGRVDQDG